jgi:hypothetical protein
MVCSRYASPLPAREVDPNSNPQRLLRRAEEVAAREERQLVPRTMTTRMGKGEAGKVYLTLND